MEIIFFWVVLTILVGVVAGSRNRSIIGWVLLSFIITPFLAFITLAVLPSK